MLKRYFALALILSALISVTACEGDSGGSDSGGGGGGGGGGSHSPSSTETSYAQQVLTLVNQERANNGGLPPLTMHGACADCAFDHTWDMEDRNFFAHTNPDGQSPFDRMAAAGITYSAAGENIAAGYGTPAAVMAGWMASAGHRANILNPNFTEIGIGVRISDGGAMYSDYWTQVFRRP
jgi:uncharacterized protein YkwD